MNPWPEGTLNHDVWAFREAMAAASRAALKQIDSDLRSLRDAILGRRVR